MNYKKTILDWSLQLVNNISKSVLIPFMARASYRRLHQFETSTVETLINVLQVTKSDALKIYRQGLQCFLALKIDFFFMSHFKQRILQKELGSTQVIGAEKLTQILRSDIPVLFITMHMGNFPLGFLKLAATLKGLRKLFVFKATSNMANQETLFSMFRDQSLEIEALHASEDGGKKAFLELRKGNMVIMMVDFEINTTSRANVTFFEQLCQMQTGPATLAVMSKAVIVPIVNYRNTDGVPTIQVESPLYTNKLSSDETNQQVIVRLTQKIASLQESWIRIDPSQVQSWIGVSRTIRRKNSNVNILNPIKESNTVSEVMGD